MLCERCFFATLAYLKQERRIEQSFDDDARPGEDELGLDSRNDWFRDGGCPVPPTNVASVLDGLPASKTSDTPLAAEHVYAVSAGSEICWRSASPWRRWISPPISAGFLLGPLLELKRGRPARLTCALSLIASGKVISDINLRLSPLEARGVASETPGATPATDGVILSAVSVDAHMR